MLGQEKLDKADIVKALEANFTERPDIGDPEYVKKRDEIMKLGKQNEKNDWKQVLGSEEGRKILWQILTQCRMFGISFRGEDTHTASHLEGMRVVGKWLHDTIAAVDKEKCRLMWNENFLKE